MPMPKGHKSERGYVTSETFEGGLNYRQIAEIMTASGSKMNHSSVRHNMISALMKVAEELTHTVGVKLTEERLKEVAGDPRFQGALCGIIRDRIESDRD